MIFWQRLNLTAEDMRYFSNHQAHSSGGLSSLRAMTLEYDCHCQCDCLCGMRDCGTYTPCAPLLAHCGYMSAAWHSQPLNCRQCRDMSTGQPAHKSHQQVEAEPQQPISSVQGKRADVLTSTCHTISTVATMSAGSAPDTWTGACWQRQQGAGMEI